jgi:hypothetical protein
MTIDSFDATRIAATNARKKAKDIRKKWQHLEPSAERDVEFGMALQGLDDAIHTLNAFVAENSAYRKDAEREIGDCYGVKGGAYRDWGKYGEAADAYDQGLPYERRFLELGGQPNSYCLVQRLVSRALKDPKAFKNGLLIQGADPRVPAVDVKAELAASLKEIEQQKEVLRAKDPWAQADYALVLLLLERGTAEAEWDNFDDMHPDSGAYQSALDVVNLLTSRLELSDAAADRWADLRDRLTSH